VTHEQTTRLGPDGQTLRGSHKDCQVREHVTITMFVDREKGWRLRGVARAQEDGHPQGPGAGEGNDNAA